MLANWSLAISIDIPHIIVKLGDLGQGRSHPELFIAQETIQVAQFAQLGLYNDNITLAPIERNGLPFDMP
jgi:hypothetical protein